MPTASPLEIGRNPVAASGLVVPLEAVLAAIGPKLTEQERQRLLIELATRKWDKVKPGDLITSALVNGLIDSITAIQLQLGKLDQGTPVTPNAPYIASVTWSGELTVGSDIVITGGNFEAGIGMRGVRFDGRDPQSYKVALDNVLVVVVPDLGTVPAAGKKVSMVVSNSGSSSAPYELNVKPKKVEQVGVLEVRGDGSVSPNPPKTGEDALFPFRIDNRTNLAQNLTLELAVAEGTDALSVDRYRAFVELLDGQATPLPKTVSIAPTQTQQVLAKIKKLPFSGAFKMKLSAASDTAIGESAELAFKAGTIDPNDEEILLEALTFDNSASSGRTVRSPARGTVGISLTHRLSTASPMTARVCSLVARISPADSGWKVQLITPSPDALGGNERASMTVNKAVPQSIELIATAPDTAAPARLEIVVTRKAENPNKLRKLEALELLVV